MKNSDIFIMIPVSGSLVCKNRCIEDLGAIFNSILTDTSTYECNSKFVNTISRKELGKIKIGYMSDEYKYEDMEWIDAYCCHTYQKISDLGILHIFINLCAKEDTQMGDIIFSGHLRIKENEQEYSIDEFVKKYGLFITGKPKIVYCNHIKEKNAENLGYLLAGETSISKSTSYKIRDEKYLELAKENISKYDFYELYASQNAIVYFLNEFSEQFEVNIKQEALLIYICEIALLQNAAISRINEQIIEELLQNSNISARKTLKLQVEFGKTILFWDNSIFNYYMSQELSNDIVKAFETDNLLEEYKRNSKHIEQIAALKSGISSEIEARILNVLAFILSISELIQLIKSAVFYFRGYEREISFSAGSIVLLLLILWLIRRKKR